MKNYDKDSLSVEVRIAKNIFKEIPCDIYLPKKSNQPVYIDLFVSLQQYKILIQAPEIAIKGKQTGNYWPLCEVSAEMLVYVKSSEIVRGEEIKEYRLRFEAWDLQRKLFLSEKEESTGKIKYQFYFDPGIDNLHLGPIFTPEFNSGYVENKLFGIKTLDIKLPENTIAVLNDRDKIEISLNDAVEVLPNEKYLECVKNILVVISFSMRRRLLCYKWSFFEKGIETTNFIKTYSSPKDKSHKKRNPSMLLFEPDTIKQSSEKFLVNPYNEYISRAIHLSMKNAHLDMDTEFVKLFLIVEILAKKCRATRPAKNAHLKTLAEEFFFAFKVDLNDLWSMFDKSAGVSLYEIRNKLTHGEVIKNTDYPGLGVAVQHLRLSVERMIAAVLEWDLSQTGIAPATIQNWLQSQNWQQIRLLLFTK